MLSPSGMTMWHLMLNELLCYPAPFEKMNTAIDTNNLYLLGAGFDKAINDKSPLNNELMYLLKLSDKFTEWSSRYEYAKDNEESGTLLKVSALDDLDYKSPKPPFLIKGVAKRGIFKTPDL